MSASLSPQLALIALSKTMARDFTGWVEGAKSQTKFVVDMADHLVALKDIAESTQSRPEAELPEVTDADVDLASDAYRAAAVSEGFDEPNDDQIKMHKRWIRAALQAAYGRQCAATRPAEVGGDGVAENSARYLWLRDVARQKGLYEALGATFIGSSLDEAIDNYRTDYPAAPGSEPDALQHKHEMGPPKSGSEVKS